MMGTKARVFAPLPPVSLEDLVPPDHFYRHLERTLDLGFVRDLVRDAYADIGRPSHRPGRLLQAAADPVLRGAALRAPADAGGRRPAQPALVSRLRPDRAAARPLQPDPHPGALRAGGLPPLLRGDRGAVPGRGVGLGPGAVSSTPPRSRPMPPSIRSSPASPSRRIWPASSPRQRTTGDGGDGSDGAARTEATNRRGCRSR